MKEATGEMNMTVVTIIAIGAIAAFFWLMWPKIQDAISGAWDKTCIEYNDNGDCIKKGKADPLKSNTTTTPGFIITNLNDILK